MRFARHLAEPPQQRLRPADLALLEQRAGRVGLHPDEPHLLAQPVVQFPRHVLPLAGADEVALLAHKPVLGQAQLRDVVSDHEAPDRPPLPVGEVARRDLAGPRPVGRLEHGLGRLLRRTGDGRQEARGCSQGIVQRRPDDGARGGAEEPARGVVEVGDAPLPVEHEHRVREALDDRGARHGDEVEEPEAQQRHGVHEGGEVEDEHGRDIGQLDELECRCRIHEPHRHLAHQDERDGRAVGGRTDEQDEEDRRRDKEGGERRGGEERPERRERAAYLAVPPDARPDEPSAVRQVQGDLQRDQPAEERHHRARQPALERRVLEGEPEDDQPAGEDQRAADDEPEAAFDVAGGRGLGGERHAESRDEERLDRQRERTRDLAATPQQRGEQRQERSRREGEPDRGGEIVAAHAGPHRSARARHPIGRTCVRLSSTAAPIASSRWSFELDLHRAEWSCAACWTGRGDRHGGDAGSSWHDALEKTRPQPPTRSGCHSRSCRHPRSDGVLMGLRGGRGWIAPLAHRVGAASRPGAHAPTGIPGIQWHEFAVRWYSGRALGSGGGYHGGRNKLVSRQRFEL